MASTSPEAQSPAQPLPLYLAVQQPTERNRLTAAIRIIMIIPQVIILFFIHIAAFFVAIVGWFAALVTGRLPFFAREFLSGVTRWDTRVWAYYFFLTDEYPPFSLGEEPQYAVQIAIPADAPLNRLAVLGRIFIAIPGYIVTTVCSYGAFIMSIASWFMILFTGRMPRSLFEVVRAAIRYQLRFYGYFLMLTAEYSWGLYGDVDAPPFTPELEAAGADVDPWRLRLSAQARPVMTVLVVLGVVWAVLNYARY